MNLLCGPAVRALLWTGGGGEHGHGREGFAFGTSTDVNDLWQFRRKSLLIAQLVLCQ